MMSSSKRYWGRVAALLHRLSGLALACFLPLHFLALALALEGEESLQSFIEWTESPLLKLSELALVSALALHLGLGMRVLAIEYLPWKGLRSVAAAGSMVFTFVAGGLFLAALG